MQPLPADWVDALFARLAVRYGSAWTAQWAGYDIAAVKADWAMELGNYAERADAIKHALNHLPDDRPPTVGQFRRLCRNAPDYFSLALPAPKPTDEAKAAVRAMRDATKARIFAKRVAP
jgi:hypothetical protein